MSWFLLLTHLKRLFRKVKGQMCVEDQFTQIVLV